MRLSVVSTDFTYLLLAEEVMLEATVEPAIRSHGTFRKC